MSTTNLAQLLKLPAGERAEFAIALWESLTDAERKQHTLENTSFRDNVMREDHAVRIWRNSSW